jgi:hypothetical protein
MNDENANTETPPDTAQGGEPDPMEAIAAGLYEIDFRQAGFPQTADKSGRVEVVG